MAVFVGGVMVGSIGSDKADTSEMGVEEDFLSRRPEEILALPPYLGKDYSARPVELEDSRQKIENFYITACLNKQQAPQEPKRGKRHARYEILFDLVGYVVGRLLENRQLLQPIQLSRIKASGLGKFLGIANKLQGSPVDNLEGYHLRQSAAK